MPTSNVAKRVSYVFRLISLLMLAHSLRVVTVDLAGDGQLPRRARFR